MSEASPAALSDEPAAENLGPPSQVLCLAITMDSHRVTGEFRYQGASRRLVDILNSLDAGGVFPLYDARLLDAFGEAAPLGEFELVQVRREAIILAELVGDDPVPPRPMEAVTKAAFPVTFTIPGYQVAGNAYLLPEADPVRAPFLTSKHFIPMTGVTITPVGAGCPARQSSLAILNLARALFFAPSAPSAQR